MLTLQLKSSAVFPLICLLIALQTFPAAATKVKTKAKTSAISSASASLAINKMTNSKSHLVDITSSTLPLSAKKLTSGIGLYGIGQKQRHTNDKDQMLVKKRILRTVYQPQSTGNLAGISLNENDLSTKHRRKVGDKLSKKFRLLRDVNVEQSEDEEDERDMAAMEARNVNMTRHGKNLNGRISSSLAIVPRNGQHIFPKPTVQAMTTHPPQTSSPPPTATTISSYTTTSSNTMSPGFHNIRNVYKNKLTENLRLLSSGHTFDNGQLAKSYRHYQSGVGAGPVGSVDDEDHPSHLLLLPSLGALHPPMAKESIDLNMNAVDEEDEQENEHKDHNRNMVGNGNTKEKDVIKTIIGEVGGDYGGGERGGEVDNNNDNDDDNDKPNDDADADADEEVEDEGIMDDLNGFDASEDSDDDDDDDDDDDEDDANNVDADENETGTDGDADADADDDDDDNSNTNTNDVPAEDSDNPDEDANTTNNNNSDDEAPGNDNDVGVNDDGNTETEADIDVGDDVFDNDYSDTDDVFSDLSAYQNDEDESDYDTTTSSSLLPINKYHNDDNNLDNSKHPYNNFTETYIKDKKNELSLDNYLRKTLSLPPVAPSAPSAEVLKSELNIPITKIDNSLLVDFHVKSNHTISLQSQDFNFLSNNFIQENDSMSLEAYATSTPKELTADVLLASSDLNMEPQISASTSVGGINLDHQHHQNTIYEKEEINFNDSEDATSLSKDLTMDDAYIENNHANGFPLTDTETDSDSESLSLDVAPDSESNENNRFLEGVVDAANADEIYDWDEISRSNRRNLMRGRDVVTKFLQIVETQHSLGSNCEAGTSLNLGEGVVDRYAQDRFRIEAEVAVNRANMLTSFNLQLPASCAEPNGVTCSNNKCRIKVQDIKPLTVVCDGDWIVIQRRINGSVSFNRDWSAYKNGFGDLDGEFWLGLDNLHNLTKLAPAELLIKMKDFDGTEMHARYSSFAIDSENNQYQLYTLGTYSGNAGDSLRIHKDEKFTTYNFDNDKNGAVNCAQTIFGGWWFYDCDNKKNNSNLNGQYYNEEAASQVQRRNGIKWTKFRGQEYSLKFVQMMIRKA